MANSCEKAISILAGNLNLGHGYLITTVPTEENDKEIPTESRSPLLAA